MKLENLIKQKQQQKTDELKWVIFESKKLKTQICLLTDKKYLKEARLLQPNLVIYFKPEIEELWNAWVSENQNDEIIKTIHNIKKIFNGWLLPDKENQ
jgi:hypothetical protein